MSTRILNAQGILSSDVPTGNLLWVDAVNGVDGLATRGRLTIPFRTLTAAKTAAQSGDTIMVLPGTYNEKNLLKEGVNWHFMNGAVVQYTGTDAGAIFDTSSNGANAAVTSTITGFGKFIMSASGTGNHVVHSAVGNASARLVIQGRLLSAVLGAVKINVSAGALEMAVLEYINTDSGDAVLNAGSSIANIIRAHSIFSSAGVAVRIDAGSVDVFAHRIAANGSGSQIGAVMVTGGSGSSTIRASEVYALSIPALRFSASSSAKVTVHGARLKSDGSTSLGRAVNITSSANDSVRLPNCVLIAAGDYSIGALNAGTRVHVGSGIAANLAANNVSFVPSGFSLQPDTNVS